MRVLLWSISFLLFPTWLLAQVEVNVRLRASSQSVKSWLDAPAQAGKLVGVLPSDLAQACPFLEKIAASRSLSSQPQQAQTMSIEQIYTLRVAEKDASRFIQQLRTSGLFEYVERVKTYQVEDLTFEPNDDSLGSQWYLDYVQAPQAWDITRGSATVRVGVLDTGLDYDHPEFEGQVAINAAEDANGNGRFDPWPSSEIREGVSGDFDNTDGDGNGFVDDVIGYDFVDQPREPFGGDFLDADPDPLDDNQHGTLVAGVIAAKADNNYGGSGLAPDCKIFVLRAFAATGAGEDDDIARAIVYAADQGVKILNLSFGDVYASSVMHEAIRYAYSKGVVMFGSAGNGTGDALHYPSGYQEVISVSASHADLASGFEFLWPLSSYGLTVDFCAPGADIFTTDLRDTSETGEISAFTRTQGTSFAAPMGAAAAALIMSQHGIRSPEQIRGILTTTADDIAEDGWDHFTGAGRLNLLRALNTVGFSHVAITSPIHDRGSALDTVAVVGTVLDPELVSYAVEYRAGTTEDGEWQSLVADQFSQRQNDTLVLWDVSELPEGKYTLRLRVNRSNGATREDRIRFIRDTSAPQQDVFVSAPIWDNERRAFLLHGRSDDAARHVLHLRQVGDDDWRQVTVDAYTRGVSLLVERDLLRPGVYEWFWESQNRAGLRSQTPVETFVYDADYIGQDGWEESTYGLPVGRMIERPTDFDQDGLPEVILNPYGTGLSLGMLFAYEFNGSFFRKVDSFQQRSILIPRDVADSDGDGLQELLVSVNDSLYLLEQTDTNGFPQAISYSNEGNERYAARFADTDADGQLELLAKDFEDYFILERQGDGFSQVAQLEDISPNYEGSIAPRVLVADFDQDGQTEIVYGDFDGDVLVYEHRGGNEYVNTLIDTSAFTKSGSYLTQGDFDGDGQVEIFVAAHPSPLRNADFENNPAYWWLRILKATSNDQYEVVWEDYLYDLDVEELNAATVGNLDADAADELIFTTYPRTYVLEYVDGQYQFTWFYYGSLASQHIIGDFNGNGQNELGLGRIDSLKFFEKDLSANGPTEVSQLEGFVLGPDRIRLRWPPSPGATGYEIWRVPNPEVNDTAQVLTVGEVTTFEDIDLMQGVPYLYVLRAVNPAREPTTSAFGQAVILTPRERVRLDSAVATSPRQVALWFSQPVTDAPDQSALIRLNEEIPARNMIRTGQESRRLLVSFNENFINGLNRIWIDTTFVDAERTMLDPGFNETVFVSDQEEDNCLHLTRWRMLDGKNALLRFNLPLDETLALDPEHYQIHPTGVVSEVNWHEGAMDAVRVTIGDARLGALGYPVSLTVREMCAINETCLCSEGNTATFSSHQDALSDVFAYPNPVRPHSQFEGMRFANLTERATVEIFSLSGRFINRLEETDGDGGLTWNLRDQGNLRIKPGVYIYYVSTEEEGVVPFEGTFTVVE